MSKVLLLIIAGVLFVSPAATAQTTRPSATKKSQPKSVYACPMHPDVTSTKPGKCRKCGMDLRKTKTVVAEVPPELNPVDPVADPTTPKTESYSFNAAKIPHARVLDQNGKQLD